MLNGARGALTQALGLCQKTLRKLTKHNSNKCTSKIGQQPKMEYKNVHDLMTDEEVSWHILKHGYRPMIRVLVRSRVNKHGRHIITSYVTTDKLEVIKSWQTG